TPLFLLLLPPPPRSTLFPYTTLFRSRATPQIKKENSFAALGRCFGEPMPRSDASESLLNSRGFRLCHGVGFALGQGDVQTITLRSEEHTSELQSPYDLVCRLLLEKKK